MKIDNTSIYWQGNKTYLDSDNKPKSPGNVRNITEILKKKRIEEAKAALSIVQEMKQKKATAVQAEELPPEPPRELKTKRKYRGEYLDAFNSIPVIHQLMTKAEYCKRYMISGSTTIKYIQRKRDCIKIGIRYFIFKDGTPPDIRKRIRTMLDDYVSFAEASNKYKKSEIYTASFLIHKEAIRIGKCLLVRKSKL